MNTTSTTRQCLKRVRAEFLHLFPGLVRIVRDPRAGTIKFSFMETKVSSIIKHRVLLGQRLAVHDLPVHDPERIFKIGTWRYKADRVQYSNPDSQKKRVYYVLTFFFDPSPDCAKITCNFVPQWRRAIVHKSQGEINNEIRKVFSNSLLKHIGITTTRRRAN